MASIDYYNDPSSWGNYQYVTLDEIINNYMMSRDSDDFTSTVPRYKVLYQAKRGLRELYYDVVREIRAIELDLSPTLNVTVPPDFVNFVRISWIDENGQLHPMAVDSRMSMAQVYLQDHEYNLLFDADGCVLQDDGSAVGSGGTVDTSNDTGNTGSCSSYSICGGQFQPNKNFANSFPNGRVNLDKASGVLQFGSDVQGRSIVIEYISDGLFTGCEGRPEAEIRIHKFAESALLDFIYYQLIKNRRNVPANEKFRARKEFYNSRRVAKRRINTLRYSDILQTFKGANKWIKS